MLLGIIFKFLTTHRKSSISLTDDSDDCDDDSYNQYVRLLYDHVKNKYRELLLETLKRRCGDSGWVIPFHKNTSL